ncbi:hypothetical protein BGZ95_004180 [Linnemannia exigua]|uniref:BTB domain-containing protein n=1 Tax=Linnemannia exigua TaxID=604196 RepID=A0AAD4D3A0_9FUNG|nr:hypothetical protein BGZ95_004180 [Linnemannia exigua]
MTSTATVTRFQEVTLKVEAPLLKDGATSRTETVALEGNSIWSVSLTRNQTNLSVSVAWTRRQNQDITNYTWMTIVPHSSHQSIRETNFNGTVLSSSQWVQCVFAIKDVEDDGMYRFDIVISTAKDIARKLDPSPSKSCEIIPLLLKDASSVDICFTFTSDKAYSNIGLWAHRVVLSRYKFFAQLIEKVDSHRLQLSKSEDNKDKVRQSALGLNVESDDESTRTITGDHSSASPMDSRAIMIKVDKFSLATFCALLYYIYMDQIELSIDTGRFVLSATEGSLTWRDSNGKIRDAVRWPPLDQGSPWKLKDVTWDELLEAADYYGVSELRTHCLNGTLNGLNEHNAVRLVFGCDTDVKRMAMRFIVDKMDEFFKKGNGDPFAAYRDHPDCHDVLIELIALKAKKE